jgi:hypothetical protein
MASTASAGFIHRARIIGSRRPLVAVGKRVQIRQQTVHETT